MTPYEYAEPDTNVSLQIRPSVGGDAQVEVRQGRGRAYINIAPPEVPAAALALYEAAGLPEPLILPRPLDLPIGTPDQNAHVAGCAVWLENGRVWVEERHPDASLNPDNALLLAAAIAVHAEAAGEPDPAEVTPLAAAIHRAQCNTSVVPDPCDRCRETARKILLGGWKRETQA